MRKNNEFRIDQPHLRIGVWFVGRYDCVECVFQRISFHSVLFVSARDRERQRDIIHLWVGFF